MIDFKKMVGWSVCAVFLIAVTSISAQRQFINPAGSVNRKFVCLYNSSSFVREGLGKLTLADLEPAVAFCTHLVYGFAGVDPVTGKLKSLNENLDLDQGRGNYRVITQLKRRYPGLKVLLGVGGNNDPNRQIYLDLLEDQGVRLAFINSAYTLLKTYDFDGLDLSWQFPPNKPKRIRSTIGSFWYSAKKLVGAAGKPLDEKADLHREGFTSLVRDLKNAFRVDNYVLSLTVLPNVNSTIFFDIPGIVNNLDFVQLAAYDFQTPARNPKEADYPAPIYPLNDRYPESNVDYQVTYWSSKLTPPSKIIVCIPTFGRAWKLVEGTTQTGVPPIIDLEEPAPEGIQTKEAGLLSWPEICAKLPNPSNSLLKGDLAPLRKIGDPTKRYGSYAYRLPDGDGYYGLWVGYEDPESAGNKADYVVNKNLGGVCIHDVSYDDFRGACNGEKYPILRSAKYRVSVN